MSDKKFSVIFYGEILAGQKIDVVQANLASLFKLPAERIQKFFSGKPIVLKKDLSHAQALKYLQAFESAGAKVALKQQDNIQHNSSKNYAPNDKRIDINKILNAFQAKVEPVKINLKYRLRITLAALFIMMLPLVYISFITLIIYGIYYHATENLVLFDSGSKLLALILYITPIVASSILILFMLKPLFFIFAEQKGRLKLEPLRYPAIFDYVQKICDSVNAPPPSAILVDCEVNASASFNNGFSGMLSNKLVLTIGLPLIAGLDIRSLSGILAHEFGHFSQGAAMRMTYIIYSVLNWLSVAVYHRDIMDQKLNQWAESNNIVVIVVLQTSRIFIWFTRKFLYYLMKFGYFLNYSMSRQMEFDADRYETRLTGSKNFKHTTIQITRLNIAADAVNEEQNDSWYQNQQLVEDLTVAIVSEYNNQPADMNEQVLEYINEGNTHWQNTHPCDKERIKNAQQEQTDGLFNLTNPASDLITKIDKLSTQLTLLHYRNKLNLPVIKSQLVSVGEFEDKNKSKEESYQALERYFKGMYYFYVPVKLNYPVKVNLEMAAKIKQQWEKSIDLQNNAINFQHDKDHADRINEKHLQAERANILLNADIPISLSAFGLICRDKEKIPTEITNLKKQFEDASSKVNTYCQTVFTRMQLTLAISLLYPDSNELATIASQKQIHNIVKCLNRMNSILLEAKQFFIDNSKLEILLQAADGNAENTFLKKLGIAINQSANICKQHIIAMQGNLTNLSYPFEHSKDNYQLSEYIFGYDIKDMSATDIASYSQHVLNKLHSSQYHMMSLLCKYAEQVEIELFNKLS